MSNYIKTVDFGVKDSLASGNPNKLIRGSEFDTEFNAIQTAVATKSDLASPSFSGTATFNNITFTGTLTGTVNGGTF